MAVLVLVLIVFPVVVFVWECRESGRLVPVDASIEVTYQQIAGPGGRMGNMGYAKYDYYYRYSFAGRQYDRVVSRNTPESSIRSGSTVTIWVDPLQPSRGVLERGPRWWLLLAPAVTALLLAAAWTAHRGGGTGY